MKVRIAACFASAVIGALLPGCGEKTASNTPPPASAPASGNPLTAPADYVNAVGKAQANTVRVLDLAALNQAIQMYRIQESRLPANLDELVKAGLIDKVPDAPRGMQIEYDPASGLVHINPK